jgi:hypothetical protein
MAERDGVLRLLGYDDAGVSFTCRWMGLRI